MSTSESFQALRSLNPRTRAEFAQSVDAAALAVRAQIVTDDVDVAVAGAARRRRLLVGASAAGATVAAVAALFLAIGSPGGGPGVESAAAAFQRATSLTAASATRSGTAVVRITHNGEVWAGTTIRWHGADVAVSSDAPQRPGKAGSELLVVDGTLYGVDPGEGGWVVLGNPESIHGGTTPDDYLTYVREDVGGVTLRRITDGMTDPISSQHDDGSTVYSGTVAAGLIARESGFKGDTAIRVLPFGYVAHDEAADPTAPLDVAVTVRAGIVREIAVTWGSNASAWTYTVTYDNLGATPAPVRPENARPLRDR